MTPRESHFAEAANKALTAWTAEHPSREADLRQLESEIAGKKRVIDRYLRAFEEERLSEQSCSYRVQELEAAIGALETEKALLEAEQQQAPTSPIARIWRA